MKKKTKTKAELKMAYANKKILQKIGITRRDLSNMAARIREKHGPTILIVPNPGQFIEHIISDFGEDLLQSGNRDIAGVYHHNVTIDDLAEDAHYVLFEQSN